MLTLDCFENERIGHLGTTQIARSLLWTLLAMVLTSCGGGDVPQPAQFSQKTVSGTVVAAGKPMANASVRMLCYISSGTGDVPDDNGVLDFFTTTDANGAYAMRADTARSSCIVQATSANQDTILYSYVRLVKSGNVTAQVTPITDAILADTLGSSNFLAAIQAPRYVLFKLNSLVSQGADSTAWDAMRTKLLSGTYIKAAADIAAMPADPVTGELTISTGTSAPAGYFSLLNKLATSSIDNTVLLAITQGDRFIAAPGTNGAEVKDLRTKWIWQRCVFGMVWDGTTCTGTPTYVAWSDLNAVVNTMPRSIGPLASQWLSPSSILLRELLTTQGGTSSMDPTWFPNDPGGWTWTADPVASLKPYVGSVVNMQTGVVGLTSADGSFFRAPATAPATTNTGKYLVRLFRI